MELCIWLPPHHGSSIGIVDVKFTFVHSHHDLSIGINSFAKFIRFLLFTSLMNSFFLATLPLYPVCLNVFRIVSANTFLELSCNTSLINLGAHNCGFCLTFLAILLFSLMLRRLGLPVCGTDSMRFAVRNLQIISATVLLLTPSMELICR